MRIGDYVRVNSPSSKNHGKDGLVTKIQSCGIVTVKMRHNGSYINIKRYNLIKHNLVLWMRKTDGCLGTMPSSNKFISSVGDQVVYPANVNMFVPFFFQRGERVRLMHNSVGYVGEVTEVSIQHSRVQIRFVSKSGGVMELWRNMKDLSLANDKEIPEKEAKPVTLKEPVIVKTNTEFELTVVKSTSPEKHVTIFNSIDAMKSYLDNVLNPAIVKSISYREIKKVYGDAKPIKMKTVTTFEL